jgi:hypothetical protein
MMLRAAAATAMSLALISPFLWHAFVVSGTSNAPARSPFSESADVLNYLIPTHLIWLQLPGSRSVASHFTATGAERGAYLGLPLLTIATVYLWTRRESHVARALALALFATLIASLGTWIHVAGHMIVPAPWRMLATLPVLKSVLPIRFTLFVTLVVALLAGAWLADGEGRQFGKRRWLLASLAIVFTFPTPATRIWSSQASNPAFFKTTAAKVQIERGAIVLIFPFGGAGWSMLWQAEDGFAYRLVGGHVGRRVTSVEERWRPVYLAFGSGPSPAKLESRFRSFLDAHEVDVIVVAPNANVRSRRLVAALGVNPIRSADALVYRVRPAKPALSGQERSYSDNGSSS